MLARAAHGGKEEREVEVQRMRKEIAGLEQESEEIKTQKRSTQTQHRTTNV